MVTRNTTANKATKVILQISKSLDSQRRKSKSKNSTCKKYSIFTNKIFSIYFSTITGKMLNLRKMIYLREKREIKV